VYVVRLDDSQSRENARPPMPSSRTLNPTLNPKPHLLQRKLTRCAQTRNIGAGRMKERRAGHQQTLTNLLTDSDVISTRCFFVS